MVDLADVPLPMVPVKTSIKLVILLHKFAGKEEFIHVDTIQKL